MNLIKRSTFVHRFGMIALLSALFAALILQPPAFAAPQFTGYEAETAQLSGGASVSGQVNLGLKYPCVHPEYSACVYWYDYAASGGKYVSGLTADGSKVTFTVQSSYSGDFKLPIRYTTPTQQDSSLSIQVQDSALNQLTPERKVHFPAVYDDPTTPEKTPLVLHDEIVRLAQGTNYITLERTADDTGEVYFDSITLIPLEADFNLAQNSGFESGSAEGWLKGPTGETAVHYGVDGNDVHSGNSKLYFWSETPYVERVYQKLSNIDKGLYEVSAWVKLQSYSGEQPADAHLELANRGYLTQEPSNTNVPIPLRSEWTQIKGQINVDEGTLSVFFHLDAPGYTSLQIDDVSIKPLLVNGGFEYGHIQGWTEWHPDGQEAKFGVDYGNALTNTAPYIDGGKYKLYFWNSTPYQQSVHQKVTGLANGRYKVEARVKLESYDWYKDQTRPYLTLARMEVSGHGSEQIDVPIPEAYRQSPSSKPEYQYVYSFFDVTSGEFDLGFYLNAQDNNTSMQIDSVTLYKVE